MSSPGVAGGASSVLLPAHHRQAGNGRHSRRAVASTPFVSRSRLQYPTNPRRLAFAPATEALFSRACHRPPPLGSICARTRPRTMISSCLGNIDIGIVEHNASLQNMECMARIRRQLLEPEFLPSAYDTAWVSMVPLAGRPHVPRFPQCVEWILQNQQHNGSWGLVQSNYRIDKDVISSTLACMLALKTWNVGLEHINRGLKFIGRNFSIAMDEQSDTPIGFNINFTGMLSLAMEMGLEFPIKKIDIDWVLYLRQKELKRLARDKSYGKDVYMVYISEGLGNQLDWNDVMKLQRKNGSLFNSPSTTAALLIHNHDDKALQYLNLLVTNFFGSVPTVYPINIYCQLSMVDSLEKIGISRHFPNEIKNILDMTYTFWLQRDEEIMLDVPTCAMAFRLLRMNGYNVSSDELSHFSEAFSFQNSLQGYLNDTNSVLELYKATKVTMEENELILDKIDSWSGNLLREKLLSDRVQSTPIFSEVQYALKFPFYATLERLEHKRNIEQFGARPCVVNQDLLNFAVEDFTSSQYVYQNELELVRSWVKESKLDQLQFARQKATYCYFSAAATIFPAELCDARITLAKNSILVIAVDDFFDVAGSKEELENLVALIDKWDAHSKEGFYSEHVKILFYAIYTTTNQMGAMASALQNRDVRKDLIELVVRSMMTEADWQTRQHVPSFEEYLENAIVSFSLGVFMLPTLYFVGQKLPGCIVNDPDYNELFRLMSSCGRLLNDIQGFERESSQGKLDSVSLLVVHSNGAMSVEAAKESIRRSIASCRKELLRLVLKEDSVVPRPCRELFWQMSKICHLFFSHTDGFSSPTEMVGVVNAVIHDPLKL